MDLALTGLLAGEGCVVHVLQALGEDMDPPQIARLMQSLKTLECAEKRKLQQQHDHAEFERQGMLDELYRFAVGRIADQDVAAGRAARHREKVEHRRIWAAAIHDVATRGGRSSAAHRRDSSGQSALRA